MFQLIQVIGLLGGASIVYNTIRGGSTDLQLDSVISDLTRDQTAAQNIVSTLGYVSHYKMVCWLMVVGGESVMDDNHQSGSLN